jgi:hypothetical protein
MQIRFRNRQGFRKASIATGDPNHGPAPTVVRQSALTQAAPAADAVDLRDDPFAVQAIRTLGHDADELMTEDAAESHVSFDDLEVGRTDPGLLDPNQSLTALRFRLWVTIVEGKSIFEDERFHVEPFPSRSER